MKKTKGRYQSENGIGSEMQVYIGSYIRAVKARTLVFSG